MLLKKNRVEAANLSRDTGKPAITKTIKLLQDKWKTPGFLIFDPVYKNGLAISTLKERQNALKGWVYMPLEAKKFLNDLTNAQGKEFNLRVYDGDKEIAFDYNLQHLGGSK